PVNVKFGFPYSVAAESISPVDAIVLCLDVTSSPSAALDPSVDAACADVMSRPSAAEESVDEIPVVRSRPIAADDDRSVDVCALMALVVCSVEKMFETGFTRALSPPSVAVDAGLVAIDLELSPLVPLVNAPNAARNP